MGQNPRILKSGRQTQALYEQMWNTIRSGRPWQGRVANRRKDGTFYEDEMRIAPVRAPDGIIVSYITIKRDIRKRLNPHPIRAER